MMNKVLRSHVVTNQVSYIADDLSIVHEEFKELHKVKLQIFNRAILQQEAHLFHRMPVVDCCFSGQEIYMLMGENFEEATDSIWITSKGYAVISESDEPMRYYQFGLTSEALIELTQLEAELEKEELWWSLCEDIELMKFHVSMYEKYGVQVELITNEFTIRRVQKQMP